MDFSLFLAAIFYGEKRFDEKCNIFYLTQSAAQGLRSSRTVRFTTPDESSNKSPINRGRRGRGTGGIKKCATTNGVCKSYCIWIMANTPMMKAISTM